MCDEAIDNPNVPDHRRLGRELKLFSSDDRVGAGLPLWLPDGAAIRSVLERYVADLERRNGYQHVYSPVLAKRDLYERSGHWQHYHEDMFPVMRVGSEDVVLRPMLCPHHALIFDSEARSYRQMPVRIAEIGGQYRNEQSGSLGGLARVRGMTLNDGHLFCMREQLHQEIASSLSMILEAHRDLGVEFSRMRLSLRGSGDKYVDDPELWEEAERVLRDVLDSMEVAYEAADDEAAFYGPKIDVQVMDAGRREVTFSTVQLDFLMARRFNLSYVGRDGAKHAPVVIHRSIVGAFERSVAYLIERWNGAFPVWLAPVQVMVIPIGEESDSAAQRLKQRLLNCGLRPAVDNSDESLGERVRRAQMRKLPFVAVIGKREAASGLVSVRRRDGSRDDAISVDALVDMVQGLNASRSHALQ